MAFLVFTRKAILRDFMMLTIQSYDILNFPTDSLIVSRRGVSKISSPDLLAALTKLKKYTNISKVEFDQILMDHGLNPECAYEFLEKALSIKDCTNLYFEKTIVAHDWGKDNDLEKLLKSEINTPLEISEISSSLTDVVSNKKYYIVIMCVNYDYDLLKKLYFDLVVAAPESAISVCYCVGSSYCISQPYLPKVGNPCHFCSVDRLMNYEDYQSSRNAWSKLVQFCRNKHVAVPSSPLNVLQRSLLVGALIRKIKLLTSSDSDFRYQDNILQETHIDFASNLVREASAAHWNMCDCLRMQK
ncbi:McbB family protein [Pseudomonas sp. PLMAX]|uniref:McbB family protein n=1 Tax=Pseudomonas sp. PLMAX TaxID=2201998 RepID=UPI0038B6E1AE